MPLSILRTPDAAFIDLPEYAFSPNYCEIEDGQLGMLRMHYVDEGQGPLVLLMHGEPTWSYLYRYMIPLLVDGGFRVVAPDLIGFGKSDKPADINHYSYARHVSWLFTFIRALGLSDINLFCQDWGGLLSLRLVAAIPDQFKAVCASNTALPTGQGASDAFKQWCDYAKTADPLPIGQIIAGGTSDGLTSAQIAAYDAPFPTEAHKAAARAFPALVPMEAYMPGAADNLMAWQSLRHFEKPFLTLFSDNDPITAGAEQTFQEAIPGAQGLGHNILKGGGHFLQEDLSSDIVSELIPFFKALP